MGRNDGREARERRSDLLASLESYSLVEESGRRYFLCRCPIDGVVFLHYGPAGVLRDKGKAGEREGKRERRQKKL